MSAAIYLRGNVALDSSVLVEIFSDSNIGKSLLVALQDEETAAYTSSINLAEATYIVCRKFGRDKTHQARLDLLDSGYIDLEESPRLHEIASEIKCERAIALPDCYTLAVAELTSSAPVFVSKERELVREMNKKPFARSPVFLL